MNLKKSDFGFGPKKDSILTFDDNKLWI